MNILFSPQVNATTKIDYAFTKETITATINGETDTFDFSTMPDGQAGIIETILPINIILSAERTNGVLNVKLLNFIDENATYTEKFPEWLEV